MSKSLNVKVCCRIRPENEKELQNGLSTCIEATSDQTLKILSDQKPDETSQKKSPDSQYINYTFDIVFNQTSKQEDIFNLIAKPIISNAMKGINGTLFCYGQTSSGKTFTMEGVKDDPILRGIIPRMMEYLFLLTNEASTDIEFSIKCQYFQIYNEKIQDLLNKNKTDLSVREDKNRGIWIEDCTEIYVTDYDEMYQVFQTGTMNRTVSATAMNKGSSRSHSIFSVSIFQRNVITNSNKTGKIFFVDLAGSEKMSKTGITGGKGLKEAQNINKSLMTLGMVINALSEGASHVPYRDSKLTRVLQESLGGNSLTTLIVTCSPNLINLSESLSTLRFGQRAKMIKNKVIANTQQSAKELLMKLNKAYEKIKSLEAIIGEMKKGKKISELDINVINNNEDHENNGNIPQDNESNNIKNGNETISKNNNEVINKNEDKNENKNENNEKNNNNDAQKDNQKENNNKEECEECVKLGGLLAYTKVELINAQNDLEDLQKDKNELMNELREKTRNFFDLNEKYSTISKKLIKYKSITENINKEIKIENNSFNSISNQLLNLIEQLKKVINPNPFKEENDYINTIKKIIKLMQNNQEDFIRNIYLNTHNFQRRKNKKLTLRRRGKGSHNLSSNSKDSKSDNESSNSARSMKMKIIKNVNFNINKNYNIRISDVDQEILLNNQMSPIKKTSINFLSNDKNNICSSYAYSNITSNNNNNLNCKIQNIDIQSLPCTPIKTEEDLNYNYNSKYNSKNIDDEINMNSENKKTRIKIRRTNSINYRKDSTLSNIENVINEEMVELTNKLNQYKDEVSKNEAIIEDNKIEISNLNKKLNNYEEIIKELNEKVIKKEVEINQVKEKSMQDFTTKEKKMIELINKISDLEAENYKMLHFTKDNDKKKVILLERQLKQFMKDINKVQNENKEYKTILYNKDIEIVKLKEKLFDLENKVKNENLNVNKEKSVQQLKNKIFLQGNDKNSDFENILKIEKNNLKRINNDSNSNSDNSLDESTNMSIWKKESFDNSGIIFPNNNSKKMIKMIRGGGKSKNNQKYGFYSVMLKNNNDKEKDTRNAIKDIKILNNKKNNDDNSNDLNTLERQLDILDDDLMSEI